MKVAVITAISGINNKLFDPTNVFEGVDYHAFVDQPNYESKIWKQHKVYNFTLDKNYVGRRNAKIYKILPNLFLPDYDYYFWVDSTHELIMNPNYVINDIIKGGDIALFTHKQRSCVYQEGDELINLNYDNLELIQKQIEYYKSENYPENNGLYELPCSIRKNCEKINTMNLMWWELICKYSSRDQISLPFVLNKLNIKPFILDGCANCGLNANNIMPQVRQKSY